MKKTVYKRKFEINTKIHNKYVVLSVFFLFILFSCFINNYFYQMSLKLSKLVVLISVVGINLFLDSL